MKSAKEIVNELFTSGTDEEATRLVLVDTDGKDLGGWCKQAVLDRVRAYGAQVREEAAKIAEEEIGSTRHEIAAAIRKMKLP